jgi:hypothetical protein
MIYPERKLTTIRKLEKKVPADSIRFSGIQRKNKLSLSVRTCMETYGNLRDIHIMKRSMKYMHF